MALIDDKKIYDLYRDQFDGKIKIRMLTGSASKGRNTYRVYYHCRSSCGVRYRAEDVNGAFMDELTKFIPRAGYAQLFVEGIKEAYNNQYRAVKETCDLLVS